MIYEENGVKKIEFGHGTVIVGSAEWVVDGERKGGALFFNSADKQPFGTEHPECCGKDCEEQGADTVIIFPDEKTVDLVMFYLNEVKEQVKCVKSRQ